MTNKSQSGTGQKALALVAAVVGALFLGMITVGAHGMGKKYSEQGARLTSAMNKALLDNGFCNSPRECYDILPGTFETDSMVIVAFFEVSDKNYEALLNVIDLTLREGIRITSGVPIRIDAFRETHDSYRKSGLIIKDVKPFITMEINK